MITTLPSTVLDLLDEGRIKIAGLIRVDLGGGSYGFIKAQSEFEYGGLTYVPGGIIEVSDIASVTGTQAQQFTLTLAASEDDGLTPEVLQTIEDEDYKDRPVRIMDAYFHPDTDVLLHVQTLKRGYIDTIDHDDDPNTGYKLIVSCETRALDYTRTNGRLRTVADQARRAPDDLFFAHAATRGRIETWWGRKKKVEEAPASTGSTVSLSTIFTGRK